MHTDSRRFRNLLALAVLAVPFVTGCGSKPETIKLDPKMFEMAKKGETRSVAASVFDAKGNPIEGVQLEWSSSDPKIASVENGQVKAVSSGTATITARIGEINQQAMANVHIPTQVSIEPATMMLRGAGTTRDVKITVTDDKGKEIAGPKIDWTSENPAVATVTESTITAVSDGVTKLTARSGDVSATIDVLVQGPQPATIVIDPSPVVLKTGANQQLNTQVTDDQGLPMTAVTLAWTSADPGVAEVTPGGSVNAVSRGETTVTASAGDASGSVLVKVR